MENVIEAELKRARAELQATPDAEKRDCYLDYIIYLKGLQDEKAGRENR